MSKVRRFQKTLWDLQKRWGADIIHHAAEVNERQSIPTGFASLDTILSSQGIPYRAMTTLFGAPTSGMTTLTQKIIANANTPTLYIDLGETFDGSYASRCGVDLDKLLLVRPKHPLKALEIARDLLMEKSIRLIVFDLGVEKQHRPLPQLANMLQPLTHSLHRSSTAFLCLLPVAWQKVFFTHADLVLEMQCQNWLYERHTVVGCHAQIRISKDKRSSQARSLTITIQFEGRGDGE